MDERGGLPSAVVDHLSNLLTNMGKKLATNHRCSVPMVSVQELVDMPIERVVEAPPVVSRAPDEVEDVDEAQEDTGQDDGMIELDNDVDVDDIEPMNPLTISEARTYAERLHEFVSINEEHIKRAGPSNKRDYPLDMDVLLNALLQMNVTSRTRQVSLIDAMGCIHA